MKIWIYYSNKTHEYGIHSHRIYTETHDRKSLYKQDLSPDLRDYLHNYMISHPPTEYLTSNTDYPIYEIDL